MATLTIEANKSSAFLERISDGLRVGAGADHHMPASPDWSGHRERSAVGFSVPASTWDDMGEVSEVALLLTTTGSGVHVGRGGSPSCQARRITESWTPNGDSMDSGSATTAGLVYPGPATTATNAVTIASSGSGGEVDVVRVITNLARAWFPSRLGGSGSSCYGVLLVQGSSSSDTTEFYSSRAADSWKRPKLRITYTPIGSGVPNSPSLVAPVGPLVNANTFSITSSSVFTAYDVQVSTDKTFATVSHWNAANIGTGIAVDGKSADTPYTGTAFTPASVTYWWRSKVRNATGWGSWSAAVSFTVDPAAMPSTQLDHWADTILAELAAPRRHTILGTIIPKGPEVLRIAGTDYSGRWYLSDANHGARIERVVELVGLTLRVDHGSGWSIDATTHDLGGYELVPPDPDYPDRVLGGAIAPVPHSHWSLGETSGSFANTGANAFTLSLIVGALARGAPPLAGVDGAVTASTANAQLSGGNVLNPATVFSAAAWVRWSGSGELYVLDKLATTPVMAGWRVQITTTGALRAMVYDNTGAGGSTASAAGLVIPGRVHHVAFSITAPGEVRLYLDGELVTIGTRANGFGYSASQAMRVLLNGTIDEISAWFLALTDAQIAALYRR